MNAKQGKVLGLRSKSNYTAIYNGVMRTSKSPARKAAGSRNGSHREGLRAVRIWIPDLDADSFRVEAHRQSAAVATSAGEREDQDFVDAISDGASETE